MEINKERKEERRQRSLDSVIKEVLNSEISLIPFRGLH